MKFHLQRLKILVAMSTFDGRASRGLPMMKLRGVRGGTTSRDVVSTGKSKWLFNIASTSVSTVNNYSKIT